MHTIVVTSTGRDWLAFGVGPDCFAPRLSVPLLATRGHLGDQASHGKAGREGVHQLARGAGRPSDRLTTRPGTKVGAATGPVSGQGVPDSVRPRARCSRVESAESRLRSGPRAGAPDRAARSVRPVRLAADWLAGLVPKARTSFALSRDQRRKAAAWSGHPPYLSVPAGPAVSGTGPWSGHPVQGNELIAY